MVARAQINRIHIMRLEGARKHRMTTVCFIGTFPPTAGGQGLVNESFRRMALEAGADVSTIDLSPRPGPLTWRRRASRIPKVLVAIPRLVALLARRRIDTAYIGVAGGYGQLYDIIFAGLFRLSRIPLFLHYDGYAYLLARRRLTATLVQVAGPSTTHIVLCDDMQKRLHERYGYALRVIVVSNSTNTEPPTRKPRARSKLKTIGFISHLSRSKGVLEFLDVAALVCGNCPDIRALLAGSIEEPSLRSIIKQRVAGAPWITYLGPVYGEPKSRFFADVDALVYPTRNDAEPRVIHEALAHGVAVVARDRGCIASVLGGGGGAVVGGTDFVRDAERLLLSWHQDPALFSSISAGALANSARMAASHGPRLSGLIDEMVSVPRHA